MEIQSREESGGKHGHGHCSWVIGSDTGGSDPTHQCRVVILLMFQKTLVVIRMLDKKAVVGGKRDCLKVIEEIREK